MTEPSPAAQPLLDVQHLEVVYRGRRLWPWKTVGRLTAVRDLSFQIAAGETFALVGESGSGKSTVARAVEGLVPARQGRILFEGHDVTAPIGRREARGQPRVQIIFQDPHASLHSRPFISTILSRP